MVLYNYPGRQFLYNNLEYLYFGGTAYLGIQNLPEFKAQMKQNIELYGTNYGASRLSNIQLGVYDKAETQLSDWVGCEASISLSSGYLAGQLIVQFFQGEDYIFFHAPNTHTALQLFNHSPYKNYQELGKALDQHLLNNNQAVPVLLLDTIDFKNKHFPDFEALRSLPLESCILIADDSHGIGLVGPEGEGCYDLLSRLEPKELLVCCSLGKALGIQAGAVFGRKDVVNALRQSPFYAGASPTPAAFMATFTDAFHLYKVQREKLLNHIRTFRKALKHPEIFRAIEDYPVFEFGLYTDERHP